MQVKIIVIVERQGCALMKMRLEPVLGNRIMKCETIKIKRKLNRNQMENQIEDWIKNQIENRM